MYTLPLPLDIPPPLAALASVQLYLKLPCEGLTALPGGQTPDDLQQLLGSLIKVRCVAPAPAAPFLMLKSVCPVPLLDTMRTDYSRETLKAAFG